MVKVKAMMETGVADGDPGFNHPMVKVKAVQAQIKKEVYKFQPPYGES